MKTKLSLILALLSFSPLAQAQVMASPGYQDLGTVSVGQSRMTNVTFMNMSSQTIQGVNVFCSGGFGVFSCSSSCFQLQPHGMCSVMVMFRPQNNDGMRQSVNLNLSGMGAFATATVSGTDARAQLMEDVNVDESVNTDEATQE